MKKLQLKLKRKKNKFVGVREFSRLLGVGANVWYSYLKRDQVSYHNDEEKIIDYPKMLAKIREISINPNYYTDFQISKRRVAKGYITPEEANKEITGHKNKESRKTTNSLSNDENTVDNVEEPNDEEITDDMTRRQAETVKQIYLAKKAKVSFLKDIGALTDTKVFMDHAVIMATNVQKAILSVPGRVSDLYASMSDGTDIKKDLTKELTFALSKLKFEIEGVTTDIDKQEIEELYDTTEDNEKGSIDADISEAS